MLCHFLPLMTTKKHVQNCSESILMENVPPISLHCGQATKLNVSARMDIPSISLSSNSSYPLTSRSLAETTTRLDDNFLSLTVITAPYQYQVHLQKGQEFHQMGWQLHQVYLQYLHQTQH